MTKKHLIALGAAALFLVSGYLISRRGSALISDFGGVEKGQGGEFPVAVRPS